MPKVPKLKKKTLKESDQWHARDQQLYNVGSAAGKEAGRQAGNDARAKGVSGKELTGIKWKARDKAHKKAVDEMKKRKKWK